MEEGFMLRVSCALLFLVLAASEQIAIGGTIKGHVKETKSKSGIVGAAVFLDGTSFGTMTDTSGAYEISDVPAGSYKISAYGIGYTNAGGDIDIPSDTSVLVRDFTLKENAITLRETIIEARANNTLETAARATEKNSENIVNVISAQAIEQSTDLSAADVMQRVSGMSLIRQQGEARYVVMRGLEQQYNNTLVDGIKIPSPEAKDRFVPLDIFPSSLFERIEVEKSLTPDLAGDAIGGSTDLILRKAPQDFTFSLSAASGSSSGVVGSAFSTFDRSTVNDLDPERLHGTVDDENPTTQIKPRYNPTPSDFTTANLIFTNKAALPDGLLNGLVGDRFLDNRFGIMAAGAFQNTYVYVPVQFYSVSSDINTFDQSGHLIPYRADSTDQNYYTNRMRGGAVLNADFIASEGHELSATYMYVVQQEAQTRHETQVTIDGERGAADFTYSHRSALRTQDISSISLGGRHFTDSPISITWTLNYTDALQDRPDEAEYSVYQNYNAQHVLSGTLGLADITHDWRRNDDRQYLGKLDGTYHLTSDGTQTFQVGMEAQGLRRANYEDDYKLNPYVFTSGPYAGHTEPFTTIDSAVVTVFGYGTTSGTSVYGYQNYKASEVLLASYFEYKAILGQLQILGGMRWEQAHDIYNTMANPVDSLRQANIFMVNILPGIHFRYELTPEQLLHFSVTQSMSRPSYFDLVPAVDRSDESSSTGNPGLRPAVSTNVDLRYEYYPNSTDVFSAGVYYKRIKDPIEDEFNSIGVVLNTTKINGDPATVYGFEGVISKHIGNFGATVNYAYVISKISSIKQVTVEDINSGDLTQLYYKETTPLPSQSPQVVNVILSYDNPNWGTKLELAYNYTGKRLRAVAQLDGYDTYEEGVGQLDFSGEQTLLFNLKLNLKLTNLTNAQDITEIETGEYLKHVPIVVERDLNKMGGSVGISYDF
ncbi:MAG TPA: TonB-dependent receptor [Candidatus Acidoferrales bacterium]|nr:TonB-dependent receptor [Candidatus Acidoferrales bacterium]